MHPNSMRMMGEALRAIRWTAPPPLVADVGSQIVKGQNDCYRTVLPAGWRYVGYDMAAGRNVDVVMTDPYSIPAKDETYDFVISGQCIEHVPLFWLLLAEMVRILKPGGTLFAIAPWRLHVHRYPVDCWRMLPDGMTALLKRLGLEQVRAHIDHDDTFAAGTKPRRTTHGIHALQ